ncbi:MAG: glycosyltransferase family 4 protein [Candidatus Omnitrophica bacterium]|nr:glycosyltransferase family 4 protein [Candidatus Omnitrophota bacterium]
MKVLFLANHFNTGGITTYIMTLSRALIGRGHSVLVASSGGNMVGDLELLGARHVPFAFNVKCDIHPRVLFILPRLGAMIRRERVGIIHAQTRFTQVNAALASRLCGVPYVTTCHGFFNPHWGRRLLPLWGRRVIAVSAPVERHLLSDLRVASAGIALIPNGIDPARFVLPEDKARVDLRHQWGLGDEPLVGIIARLSDVKGHRFLIDAMPMVLAKHPRAKCLIFGDGPMENALKALAKERGLGTSVIFYPVVNRTCEILPLLDVFVMPSLQEGLGLSVLEAAAMGIPAVVSRVGGLPDIVKEGVTGLLVEPADSKALAHAISSLLTDKARALAMGRNAREFVLNNFSADKMVDETLQIYTSIVGIGKDRS